MIDITTKRQFFNRLSNPQNFDLGPSLKNFLSSLEILCSQARAIEVKIFVWNIEQQVCQDEWVPKAYYDRQTIEQCTAL